MKKKALIVLTTAIIAVSGVFYGFTSTNSNIAGPVAAATETETPTIDPLIQDCPEKGTADCELCSSTGCAN
jgi:hypothetical protein